MHQQGEVGRGDVSGGIGGGGDDDGVGILLFFDFVAREADGIGGVASCEGWRSVVR